MVFADGDFVKWNIVVLKQFFSERKVPVLSGDQKTDIVRKCLLAQELELPVLPKRTPKLLTEGCKNLL